MTRDTDIVGGREPHVFIGGGVLLIVLLVAACTDLTSPPVEELVGARSQVPVEELISVSVDRAEYLTSGDVIHLTLRNDSEHPITVISFGSYCEGVLMHRKVNDEWVNVGAPICTLRGILSLNGGETGVLERRTDVHDRQDQPGIYRIGVSLLAYLPDHSVPEFDVFADHEIELRSP